MFFLKYEARSVVFAILVDHGHDVGEMVAGSG
jgi:hypothetical protein